MQMNINLREGINGDGFTIEILDDDSNRLFKKDYYYGYNVSYDKKIAESSMRDYERFGDIRYKQPYVTDVIKELAAKYGTHDDDLKVSHFNVFQNKSDNQKIKSFIDEYLWEALC